MMIRIALCLFLLAPLVLLANEAQIRKVLEPKLGGAKIESVRPAPIAGLFEVRYSSGEGVQILYTDATASHIIVGKIYEARTGRNLTDAIKFESLPLDLAVKIQRGNGKRIVAMFSDPYCPACRQFERTLAQVNDITIYVFMYPVIRPENADHSRAVWCSPDRAKAWLELAAAPQPKVPQADPKCTNPVDKVVDLGHKLGINSTPTLFFLSGDRVAGGLRPDDLREMLDRSATARR